MSWSALFGDRLRHRAGGVGTALVARESSVAAGRFIDQQDRARGRLRESGTRSRRSWRAARPMSDGARRVLSRPRAAWRASARLLSPRSRQFAGRRSSSRALPGAIVASGGTWRTVAPGGAARLRSAVGRPWPRRNATLPNVTTSPGTIGAVVDLVAVHERAVARSEVVNGTPFVVASGSRRGGARPSGRRRACRLSARGRRPGRRSGAARTSACRRCWRAGRAWLGYARGRVRCGGAARTCPIAVSIARALFSCLVPLPLGHRVGDDARAGLHRRDAVRDHARADRDREVHPPVAGARCSRPRRRTDRGAPARARR